MSASAPVLGSPARKPATPDRTRQRSKALFGNRDRFEVLLAIGRSEDGFVNATDLAEETGLVNTRVRAQLLALVEAELLSEVPSGGEDRKRWYRREDCSFWRACFDLHEKWTR